MDFRETAKSLAEMVTKTANTENRTKQTIKNIEGIDPTYVAFLRLELQMQGWKVAKRGNQLVMTR